MSRLRTWFTLSQLVTGGPIFLLLMLSLVLGVSRYLNAYQSELDHALREAKVGAQPILNLMQLNVNGGNYANVQDQAALELYRANTALKFFSVTGTTRANNEPYGIAYQAGSGHVIRTVYEAGYEEALKKKIERAQTALARLSADHAKRPVIEKILKEQKGALNLYLDDQSGIKQMAAEYTRPDPLLIKDGYYLDEAHWQLHLFMPLGDGGSGEVWMVLDATPLGELGSTILKSVLPVNLTVLAICVALAFLLSRAVTGPVSRMVATIERIEHDSDLTVRMAVDGRDELAKIAASFNRMQEKFQSILAEVSTATGQVAHSSQQIDELISRTAAGMEKQTEETHLLASSANEMLAAVADVSSNASLAAQSALDASEQAVKGRAEVETTIQSIRELAEDVAATSEAITQLNTEAGNIGSVVDVIKGIAEQTNLLALNAAIEAARAGDQGRGFAVVADEVRTLAMRTQESTEEIERMITHLQQGTRHVVSTMEAGSRRSLTCVEQAGQAGDALERITGAVDAISAMNTQIASAAEEQNAVTSEINSHIGTISAITDDNSGQTTACADLGRQLSTLAAGLEAKVGVFRL